MSVTEVKNLSLEEVAISREGNVADALFAISDALGVLASAVESHGETVGGAIEGKDIDDLTTQVENHVDAMGQVAKAIDAVATTARIYGRVA